MKLLSKYSWAVIISLIACISLANTRAAVKALPIATQDSTYLWIPNSFSPDGDGLNDEFKVITNRRLWGFSMDIHNVWGERIFSTEDVDKGWDGNYKNKPSPRGVYVYIVKYREEFAGVPVTKTGPLHLIR